MAETPDYLKPAYSGNPSSSNPTFIENSSSIPVIIENSSSNPAYICNPSSFNLAYMCNPSSSNPANSCNSSSSTVNDFAPVIDLTDSDDIQTPSSSNDNLNTISTENVKVETASESPLCPDTTDDSFSIVYENITPIPELHMVDFAGDLAQLVKAGSQSYGNQMSMRKVKIGSKSLNISVSISTKPGQPQPSTEEQTNDRESPEIIEDDAITKSSEKFRINCGICMDTADEITASERKLVATVCGHIYCCQCFTKSMEVSRLCPKCRKRLTKKQFHPIYL